MICLFEAKLATLLIPPLTLVLLLGEDLHGRIWYRSNSLLLIKFYRSALYLAGFPFFAYSRPMFKGLLVISYQ
jgi:hypothetical protein